MSQQRNVQRAYTEADITLAIQDITSKQNQSENRAATVYGIPRTTVQGRRAGRRPRRDWAPPAKRLTKLEEEVVVQRVLEESKRGIPSSKADVRDMADKLLQEHGGETVGKLGRQVYTAYS